MNPTVSIVVPAYNAEKYITECIESVQKQDYTNWQLFIVDDGSKDKTGEICDRFADNDSRIHVLHQMNSGCVGARNSGLKLCPDEGYITFLDSDDLLASNALSSVIKHAVNFNADIVSFQLIRFISKIDLNYTLKHRQSNFTNNISVLDQNDIINKVYHQYFGVSGFDCNLCGKLYKYSFIKKSLELNKIVDFFGEDMSVSVRLLPTASSLVITDYPLYFYRSGGGTTRFMPTFWDDCIALFDLKTELSQQYPMPQDVKYYMAVELKNMVGSYLCMYLNSGKFSEEEIKAEIARLCNVKQVEESVNHPREDNSGIPGLRELLKTKNVDVIYNLLVQVRKKEQKSLKNILKKVYVQLFSR